MRVPGLAALLLALLAGSARAETIEVDLIRVVKSARTLTLYADGQPLRTINGIQLGGNPSGPKRFQGDNRTPEGRYVIDFGKPDSAFYLSLHISYPSPEDTAYAAAQGRSPGGLIFIHGQPNGYADERVPGDWTEGCIALTNAEMDMLWEQVPDGTPIEILP